MEQKNFRKKSWGKETETVVLHKMETSESEMHEIVIKRPWWKFWAEDTIVNIAYVSTNPWEIIKDEG